MALEKGKRLINGTVDQYLVGIADGLRKAQEELSQIHVTRPGESPISYHIPSLEFELKMAFEMEEEESSESGGSALPMLASMVGPNMPQSAQPSIPKSVMPTVSPPRLRAVSINPKATAESESFQASAASTIKGKFVSVPANGGSPLPLLHVWARDTGKKTEVEIVVRVENTVGDVLTGAEVEFNIDRDYSAFLNQAAVEQGALEENQVNLPAGTRLLKSVGVTDELGETHVMLKVTSKPGQQIALAIFAAGVSESLIYETPNP